MSKLPTRDGQVSILNVGDGDTKLSFDPKNPAERIRAARIVKDMLRRGYALMIETDDGNGGKHYVRAESFDENVCEYVIADFDPVTPAEHDEQEQQDGQQDSTGASATPAAGPAPRRGSRTRTVAASSARAVAVAPISGG